MTTCSVTQTINGGLSRTNATHAPLFAKRTLLSAWHQFTVALLAAGKQFYTIAAIWRAVSQRRSAILRSSPLRTIQITGTSSVSLGSGVQNQIAVASQNSVTVPEGCPHQAETAGLCRDNSRVATESTKCFHIELDTAPP